MGEYVSEKMRFVGSGAARQWMGRFENREKGESQVNPRDHFQRNSDNNTRVGVSRRGNKSDHPRANSWFQRRLDHVRNELKKELLAKSDRLTKDH